MPARKIVIEEKENEITIESQPAEEHSRKERLVEVPNPVCGSKDNCHPLCKLPFVHEIRHTGREDSYISTNFSEN